MTKVFVGGSRRISSLNTHIRAKLDDIIHNKYMVLVGDANGVDKSVQNFLLSRGYRNVIVFCTANGCRNNLGEWETRRIQMPNKSKGFEFYSAKDLEMANAAEFGLMLWDAKSKGTLLNVINLLKQHKQTLVYVSSQKSFLTLTTIYDLADLLAICETEHANLFERKFKISQLLTGEPTHQEVFAFMLQETR